LKRKIHGRGNITKTHNKMKKIYNWGIVGTGNIANKFAEAIKYSCSSNAYAVASRDRDRAASFAKKYNMSAFYSNYEELYNDEKVDIIYVATPNHLHLQNTIKAIEKGKAVLCEKPMGMNISEVELMIKTARERKVFLMEAMWTRFLPSMLKLEEILKSGIIGEALILKADFGFKADYNPHSRLFDPLLGGGSLLDIGIYPVFLALFLWGEPENIKSQIVLSPTGTDESMTAILSYSNKRTAVIQSTFSVNMNTEAVIYGTEASVIIHHMWHMPTKMSLKTKAGIAEIPVEWNGNGYNYEIDEVTKCLDKGLTEHPQLDLDFSKKMMMTIEKIKEGSI